MMFLPKLPWHPAHKGQAKKNGNAKKNKESPGKARCCMLSWLGMSSDQFDRWAGDQDVGYATILSFVAEQFALICFLCLCCWLVGRVGPQIGPSGARTPLPLIPCQLQNPFLISFFPPTHIITPPHPSHLDQKVTFLPFLEPTGYSVTIKVYHDAITVTLSRLMDN